jgi:hypothetical protein
MPHIVGNSQNHNGRTISGRGWRRLPPTELEDLVDGPMKKSPRKVRRLLYRSGLTNNEIDELVATIGTQRLLAAVDRRLGR